MRTAKKGDRVQVHYVKRLQDGSVTSSRGRAPLEVTIGRRHPRLPGLGLALVGLAAGESTKLNVPAERAYGTSDTGKIYHLARKRFADDQPLGIGKWVRLRGVSPSSSRAWGTQARTCGWRRSRRWG